MAGSSFGTLFRIATYGESHGKGIGVVIDGCPAGLNIDEDLIASDLKRRRPGQSAITTQRKEEDVPQIISGVFEGKSTGTPIHIFIANKDHRSKDYSQIRDTFRPSHADNTYTAKYGLRDYRGGGRASARETVARVAAGAIAKMLLQRFGVSVHAYVSQVGPIRLKSEDEITLDLVESNPIRCPNESKARAMEDLIRSVKKQGDTVGGVITCQIDNCPVGLGEPVFDKLHADLGKAMLSINAVKGFEYGSGFSAAEMRGSQHNDIMVQCEDKITTLTNNNGGIQGGISNGMPIHFRIAFKPVATLLRDQSTIDKDGREVMLKGKGRHDPCVVPRAVPIVEAMAALVIADHLLRQRVSKI